MEVEEISAFEFVCKPMNHNPSPIRSCTMIIYAKNRDEADDIFHKHAYKFFDLDMNISVLIRDIGRGYRQTTGE